MITRIKIPQAFENMEEATIGKWLKSEGDTVGNGDALCELITEKTTFDLPAEDLPFHNNGAAGVLRRVVIAEKSIVRVGTVIALVGDLNDELPDVEAENAALLANHQAENHQASESLPMIAPGISIAPRAVTSTLSASTPAAGSRVRATPAARRVAKERGLSLEEIAASLPAKVLTEDDIIGFSAAS